jgi:hypothetical protein
MELNLNAAFALSNRLHALVLPALIQSAAVYIPFEMLP